MYWKESLFLHTTEIMILKQERSLKISFQMTCTFKLKRKYSEMAKEIKVYSKKTIMSKLLREMHIGSCQKILTSSMIRRCKRNILIEINSICLNTQCYEQSSKIIFLNRENLRQS